MNDKFWTYLQEPVDTSQIEIDRAKGSVHPRMGGSAYPVDYGHLQDTISTDRSEVDAWVGTQNDKRVVGVQCSVDIFKRDAELKIFIGCTDDEIKSIDEFSNNDSM